MRQIFRNEITRVLLLLLLELPPSRQSPSHIQLLDKFLAPFDSCGTDLDVSVEMWMTMRELVFACTTKNQPDASALIGEMFSFMNLTKEQILILQKLQIKYRK